MAIKEPNNNGQMPRGGADLWDDGLAGQILRNDFFTSTQSSAISGTAATSQAQSTTATGSSAAPAVTGTASNSQAQTSAGMGSFAAMGTSGNAASSQAQTANATGSSSAPATTGTAATAQAQTSSSAGTSTAQAITGSGATSQVQGATASGTSTAQSITGTGSTRQAQRVAADGSHGASVTGAASSSQAQGIQGAGAVAGVPEVVPISVIEPAGPIAGGSGWKPEKGSYWEALLKPPRSVEKEQPLAPPDAVERIAKPPVAIAKLNQIAIAATQASRQAMHRSVQAAAKAAQQQAVNELYQTLLAQQAEITQLLMNDDEDDAICALLLSL